MKKTLIIFITLILPLASIAQQGGSASSPKNEAKIFPDRNHSLHEMDNVIHVKDTLTGEYLWLVGGNHTGVNNSSFVESSINPGYPVGWITNSEIPIIKNGNNGELFICLSERENLYIGKLFEHDFSKSEIIQISYSSNNKVNLTISQFNSQNSNLSTISMKLPSGTYEDEKIYIDIEDVTKIIFVKIEKGENIFFELYNLKIIGE